MKARSFFFTRIVNRYKD